MRRTVQSNDFVDWQQKLIQCGWSNEQIAKFCLGIESVFPNIDYIGQILNEIFINWSQKELDDLFALVIGLLSNHEQEGCQGDGSNEGISDLYLAMRNCFISADDSSCKLINSNLILLSIVLILNRSNYNKICSASFKPN